VLPSALLLFTLPGGTSLVRPHAEPFLHPGHTSPTAYVSSGGQERPARKWCGWLAASRPLLDGREHGATLKWHGARQACQYAPSIDVVDAPSMSVIVLISILWHPVPVFRSTPNGWSAAGPFGRQAYQHRSPSHPLGELEHSKTVCN
jgi:hypothetical protein